MEIKSFPLEIKDIDTTKRTAVIKHAVYTSVDRVKDISTKGMFAESWKSGQPIDFLFNHETEQIPGNVTGTSEDNTGAYTEVKFGNWQLGNDVIAMAEAGVLRGASFGYITEKKEMTEIKGQKVRKLKQVKHIETSLLTKMPAHPEAGIVSLKELKSLTQQEQDVIKRCLVNDVESLREMIDCIIPMQPESDIYIWLLNQLERRSSLIADMRWQIKYNSSEVDNNPDEIGGIAVMKSYLGTLEKFSRETKASDWAIKIVDAEIEETKELLSKYDTPTGPLITVPTGSRNDSLYKQLLLLNAKLNYNA